MLYAGLSGEYAAVTQEKCVVYLSQLVAAGKLADIMVYKCSTDSYMLNGEHDSLVQAYACLPDKAANR